MLDYGNTIDPDINREIIQKFQSLQKEPLPGMVDAVPAYSSLAIYYDVTRLGNSMTGGSTAYEWMKNQLVSKWNDLVTDSVSGGREVEIPVCYDNELGKDLESLAKAKGISVEDLIRIHTGKSYQVYMLGFIPGFAYMGEVDERIAMSRKPQPVEVAAGSVGIAGQQTGIYPLRSPGGWQIIGRTPWKLFDPGDSNPTLLNAGDLVKFKSISRDEFESF